MRIFESQSGVVIKIGQNDKENDELIKTANQDYTWCHLDNQPSPHAVIESTSPDKESINDALQLVKFYSKAKSANSVNLIYAKIRDVKRVDPRKHPGLVTLSKAPVKKSIKTNFGALRKMGCIQ
ncbi:hypothetical protein M9Y10_023391 [Tritrichomonas musculus]|uniref:NFACT RNA-binding domain-containing protein n=1 Tax=Tritrichomonas musculus TaxID=1915356 RepID=A0ABR2KUY8_9EUKA